MSNGPRSDCVNSAEARGAREGSERLSYKQPRLRESTTDVSNARPAVTPLEIWGSEIGGIGMMSLNG